jgi:hypothetical protein
MVLATTIPTTLAGVVAVLQYVNQVEDTNPDEWPNTDSIRDVWNYKLREAMAAAVRRIAGAEICQPRWGLSSGTTPADVELLALAEKYVVAYREWYDLDRIADESDTQKARRAADRAKKAYMRIEQQIAQTRASSIEGIGAKLRCIAAYEHVPRAADIEMNDGGCTEALTPSIFADLEALASKG